ncbi:MAG: AAA family ATPase, partial [Chloroflexota bacterium]
WNALLQILEDGRLTDGQGRTVDFRNTIIIMTSNLGTDFVSRGGALGFVHGADSDAIADHQKIEKAMRDTFRPEFLNRIDEIIIFETLGQADVERMVDLQMRLVGARLRESVNISLHLTEPARYWLARKGYDPQYGARPLRRTIQRYVENPLSARLLAGDFNSGDLIVVDEVGEELIFERQMDGTTDYIDAPDYFVETPPTYPEAEYTQTEYVEADFEAHPPTDEGYYDEPPSDEGYYDEPPTT